MRWLVVVAFVVVASCGRSPVTPTSPDLTLSSSFLRFDARPGEAVVEQIITLADAHNLALEWRALIGAPWIQVDPREGRTGATRVRIGVLTRNLAPGVHTAGVTFAVDSEDPEARSAGLVIELHIDAPGWTALAGPACGHFRSVMVDPGDTNRIIAGGVDGEMFFSGDGGQSFQRVPMSSLDNEAQLEQSACSSNGRVYLAVSTSCEGISGVMRSNDGGVSWEPTGLMNVAIRGVGTLPSDPGFVIAAGEGIWLSTDGGDNWSVLDAALDVTRLSADPVVGRFYLTTGDKKLYVTDGGAPGELAVGTEVLDVVSRPNGGLASLIATSPYHIQLSSDGGTTWSPTAGLGMPSSKYGVPISLTADDGNLIALHERLYISRDGGEAFLTVPLARLPLSAASTNVDAAAHPDGLLVAHGSDGILRHVDGRLQPLEVFDCSIEDLEVHPSGILFGVASPGGAFRYQPSVGFEGLAVSSAPTSRYTAIAPDPRVASTVLVGGNYSCSGVNTTYDNGGSWVEETLGLPSDFDVEDIGRAPEDPDTIVLATNHGLYRSTDNGLSYAQIAPHSVTRIAVMSSTLAFANGNDGLWRWDNGTLAQVPDFDASPSLLVRTTDGSVWFGRYNRGVFRSIDNGATWIDLGMSGEDPLAVAVVPSSWLFLAFDTGLFESRDNGATWAEVGAPFPPRSLAVDGDALYVGTRDGGVYRYLP